MDLNNEYEFKKWFEKNYQQFGFSKIIRKDIGIFPDFIMLKEDKEVRVELETIASNFLLHKHDPEKVDEVICINKDVDLAVPVREIEELNFVGGKIRISATLGGDTIKKLKRILASGKYRNQSHAIEIAIIELHKEGVKK